LPPAHPLTKVNPPLRSPQDAEALIEALADGTIDAVATDHAPHAEADKAQPYQAAAFGFTGLETALPLTLDLIRHGSLDLVTLIERMTAGPARVFELDAGTLRLGAIADVCVFDLDSTWEVRPETLASKGKNTPLLGRRLTGRVMCTIVGGNVVYRVDA
jgi:dihydroorotase